MKPIIRGYIAVLVIIVAANQADSAELTRVQPPSMQLDKHSEDWEYVLNGSGLYSKSGSTLSATCSANYPIEWEITGHVDVNIVNFRPPTRTDEGIFRADLIIFFYGQEFPTSAKITCKSMSSESQLQRTLSIFVPDLRDRIFVNNGRLVTITDTDVLPCESTDPFTQINVQKQSQNGPNEIVVGKYNPSSGFALVDPSAGIYICKDVASSSSVRVSLIRSDSQDFEVHPSTAHVEAFTNENLKFSCKSRLNIPGEIRVISANAPLHFLQNHPSHKIFTLNSEKEIAGQVSCQVGQFSQQWNYKFLTPPRLYLDNHEGEVDCLSEHENKSVSTVRCKNPSDCNLWRRCFQENPGTEKNICNSQKPNSFTNSRNTRCWTGESGANCVSLPYLHYNGLAECSVGNLKKTWQYFVSLRLRRYVNWNDADVDELVRLDQIEIQSSDEQKTKIICEATSFLFADSLRIRLELTNGKFVDVNNDSPKSAKPHPRQIDEFNIIKEVNVQLPQNLKAVHCSAPWWNSTNWLSTTAKFSTSGLLLNERIRDGKF